MPFVFLQASNRSAAPQPGSRWRPEEDKKLINLLARGEEFGRHAHWTIFTYLHKTANEKGVGHRAQIWDKIRKELSMSSNEAETVFLYLCQECPKALKILKFMPIAAPHPNNELVRSSEWYWAFSSIRVFKPKPVRLSYQSPGSPCTGQRCAIL
ncbi:hypothetical protein F5Y03DRAFT_379668 [Xylaria venustula]|nr:hypothetical protein F5Y03DRAFT_379668 [Xylaria venustula]